MPDEWVVSASPVIAGESAVIAAAVARPGALAVLDDAQARSCEPRGSFRTTR